MTPAERVALVGRIASHLGRGRTSMPMDLGEVADLLDDIRDAEGRADRAEADLARARADADRMARLAEQQIAKRNEAEDRLAVLRAEVGQAVAVARSVTHAHDGVPCSSGLAHLPRAGEGCGAGRCVCGSCP